VRVAALASLTLLAACGGQREADGPFAFEFTAIEVEGGVAMATELRFLPGGDELLVASKDGRIAHLRLAGDRAERLGELRVPGVFSETDCGLISLALDPDFASNGFVYAGACASATESVILRLTFDPGGAGGYDAIDDSAVEIMRAGDPLAERPWHNVGALGFDVTGAMWALFGDKLVDDNGQDLDDDLGAVVRIVPSRHPDRGGHTPAPDNPFLDLPDRDPDVYAYGLRSPWRGAIDAAGRLWIGDVGANSVEEINILAAPGDNFGWPVHEGPCAADCAGVRDPVTSWPHDDPIAPYLLDDPEVRQTSGRVGWVGLEQRPLDDRDPYGGRLAGRMLFGDFCLGFVRALAVDPEGNVVSDEHLGNLPHAASWDQGPDGSLYAATFGSCVTGNLDESEPPPGALWRAVAAERARGDAP
jgi:Glucose / Sorbosone dehydrogenase